MTKTTITEVSNAIWLDDIHAWQASADTLIKLPVTRTAWLAVDASITQIDGKVGAALVAIVGSARVVLPLPMSLKGVINEVVALPEGTTELYFRPLPAGGRFVLHHVVVTPLSGLKRLWRMSRRIGLYFLTTPVARRRQAAILVSDLLTGIKPLYDRIGQLKACAEELPYSGWIARFDTPSDASLHRLKRVINRWHTSSRSLLIVIYPQTGATAADYQRTRASVDRLIRAGDIPIITLPDKVDACKDTVTAIRKQISLFDEVLLLSAGTELASTALGWFLAPQFRQYLLCYADHDELNEAGERCAPKFKPDWNIELSRTTHYVGDVLRIRAELLIKCGWLEHYNSLGSYGLLLMLEADCALASVGHIPAVLSHKPQHLGSGPVVELLQQHFARHGINAMVLQNRFCQLDIHYQLVSSLPLVSVVVPTRNMLSLLEPCIDSVLNNTDHVPLEIIIVDNQSDDPATLQYFQQIIADIRVKVLRYDAPFNYSAINNYAVEHASGEIICLLNNDTKVINSDWLVQMLGQLSQANVGVVGAKLLFSDGFVQHVGDMVGVGGCAAHMLSRLAGDDSGYMCRAVVSQDLSAVTAACLLTRKDTYLQLGGLNEHDLTVAFNDVDYCLKVREAGKRVVFTPLATLYHYESVSRGKDDNPVKIARAEKEVRYMQKRWPVITCGDPFYNPNLNPLVPDFRLSAAPAVEVPW